MQKNTYVIVGDDYQSFARSPTVLTETQVQSMIQREQDLSGSIFLAGLGLPPERGRSIEHGLRRNGAFLVLPQASPAAVELTHKRRLAHVLVSAPVAAGGACYKSELVIGDASDRLCDHVTGQHVSGMLLIESARQASIAAIECEFTRAAGLPPWGLVLQGFQARFDNYVFPLPTSLVVCLKEQSPGEAQKELVIEVEFVQAGKAVCGVDFSVRLYPADVLSKLEARRAKQAVASVVQAHNVSNEMPGTEVVP